MYNKSDIIIIHIVSKFLLLNCFLRQQDDHHGFAYEKMKCVEAQYFNPLRSSPCITDLPNPFTKFWASLQSRR